MNHKINSISTQISTSKMDSNMTEYTVDPDGTQKWYLNGQFHREDGPAVIFPSGTQQWYKNGKLHREDGPALIHSDGSQFWYLNGYRHREDGPAVTRHDGRIEWYLNGIKQDKFIINTNHNIKNGF